MIRVLKEIDRVESGSNRVTGSAFTNRPKSAAGSPLPRVMTAYGLFTMAAIPHRFWNMRKSRGYGSRGIKSGHYRCTQQVYPPGVDP